MNESKERHRAAPFEWPFENMMSPKLAYSFSPLYLLSRQEIKARLK
jgi:hypothetical protein